jgi:hypothetical protein
MEAGEFDHLVDGGGGVSQAKGEGVKAGLFFGGFIQGDKSAETGTVHGLSLGEIDFDALEVIGQGGGDGGLDGVRIFGDEFAEVADAERAVLAGYVHSSVFQWGGPGWAKTQVQISVA